MSLETSMHFLEMKLRRVKGKRNRGKRQRNRRERGESYKKRVKGGLI